MNDSSEQNRNGNSWKTSTTSLMCCKSPLDGPMLIQIDKFKHAEVCKTYGMYVYIL